MLSSRCREQESCVTQLIQQITFSWDSSKVILTKIKDWGLEVNKECTPSFTALIGFCSEEHASCFKMHFHCVHLLGNLNIVLCSMILGT